MASRLSICVYCSSSNTVAPEFFASAKLLGEAIARRGFGLVFGGTNVGLMGEVARTAHEHGAHVTGVMPQAFAANNSAFQLADELIVTTNLRERKATMEARSDAFIALPGGFGTLEEVLEILTLKQLQFHTKPVVFLNANGFYDHLVEFFERLRADNFLKPGSTLYYIAADADDALDYIVHYEPITDEGAWF